MLDFALKTLTQYIIMEFMQNVFNENSEKREYNISLILTGAPVEKPFIRMNEMELLLRS
jgi:hypothetical protein